MMINLKNKRGVILIVVYLLVTVLLTFSIIFISRTVNEKNIALRQKNISFAFYLAEAGLDAGFNWLALQSVAPSVPTDPFGGLQTLGEGTYQVTIEPAVAIGNLLRFRITSIGRIGDIAQQLVNEVQEVTFARYAYFSNTEHYYTGGRWITPVWLSTGDVLKGLIHTNEHFHIKGNPVFTGQVESGAHYMEFFNNGDQIRGKDGQTSNPPNDVPDFQQGIKLGGVSVSLPTSTQIRELKNFADNEFQLSGSTTILLNADGTMNVTNAAKDWDNRNMPLPANGIIYSQYVKVSGTLDGRLTIVGETNICVTGNITYEDKSFNSDDILGLIAKDGVIISKYAPDKLNIDAAILARGKSSFVVEDWWKVPAKDTLTVYGSIVQNKRGPVGTTDEATGSKLTGYTKDYDYDPRLLTMPPPFYPKAKGYVSLSWED